MPVKAFVLELLTGRGPLVPLVTLLGAGALIFLVAARLARHANAIAEATGLGGLWIGSVLLAGGTSLPEVLTDLNAVMFDTPDIGVGDLLGSTLANMLILAILDLVFARRRILHQVAVEHTRVGLLAILLTLMAGIAIWTGGWGRVGHVGLETIAIAVVYGGGMWPCAGRERSAQRRPAAGTRRERGESGSGGPRADSCSPRSDSSR